MLNLAGKTASAAFSSSCSSQLKWFALLPLCFLRPTHGFTLGGKGDKPDQFTPKFRGAAYPESTCLTGDKQAFTHTNSYATTCKCKQNPVAFPHTHANNAANTQTDTTSRCWVALVMRRVVDGAHLCLWLSTVLLCNAAQAAGRGVQELPKNRSHWTHTRRLAGDALLAAHGGLLSPPSPPSESQTQTAALLLLLPSLSAFHTYCSSSNRGKAGGCRLWSANRSLSLSLALCLSTKSSSKLPWLWRKIITKSFLPPFSAYLW